MTQKSVKHLVIFGISNEVVILEYFHQVKEGLSLS